MFRIQLLALCTVAALACTRTTEPTARPPAPQPPPPAAALGRRLFQRGVGEDGAPLRAFLGEERVELSGRAAACANCHHHSGTGTKEGGVAAPDITARTLFQARAGDAERARPAYDDASLVAALTRGVTPSGRTLSIAMPRFALDANAQAGLVAYLHLLGEEQTPGVEDGVLRVGALLPLSGPLAEQGEDVRAVLRATFEELNARGGIYRRRLELVVEDEARPDGVARLLASGVLALVGPPSSAARAPELQAALEGVPVLAPLGSAEAGNEAPVFFLYPGPELQARVAVRHLAGEEAHASAWVVVAARTRGGQRWAEGARLEAVRRQHAAPIEHTYPPGQLEPAAALATLRAARATAVLFHGTREELLALLAAQEAAGDRTPLFAPVQLAAEVVRGETPKGMERVTFVSPTLVDEELRVKGQGFLAFLARHQLRPRHLAFQMSAYASARLLEDALERTGAAVTREGLVSALEATRALDTGVAPPITFGVSRRVGIQGASLVRWNAASRRLERMSPWLEAGP
ncbi:MAG: ABC transporter substrate-binding protein [Myxococcaceae bacterium]|nr:ABC transporter substrate-binding protein [Myxococcaceae bacterium]MCI0672857.1 ABC transporter substrate-binding protein [Myxococcaceae bacterium]